MALSPSLRHLESQRGGGHGMLVGGQPQLTPGGGGWIFGRSDSIERPGPVDLGLPVVGGSPYSRHGSIRAVWGL